MNAIRVPTTRPTNSWSRVCRPKKSLEKHTKLIKQVNRIHDATRKLDLSWNLLVVQYKSVPNVDVATVACPDGKPYSRSLHDAGITSDERKNGRGSATYSFSIPKKVVPRVKASITANASVLPSQWTAKNTAPASKALSPNCEISLKNRSTLLDAQPARS